MHLSVEASLKKLRTTYIDILYVHWWDYTTTVEEVMNNLHALVTQGKVLYLVSDHHIDTSRGQVVHPKSRSGRVGYTRMGRREGEQLCPYGEQDSFRGLSRRLEHFGARL